MDCTEIQSIVAGEREGDLTEAESRLFEAHLAACGACRTAIERAEEDLDRLAALVEAPELPASAWARVDAAVKTESRQRVGREDPFSIELVGPAHPTVGTVAPAAPAVPVLAPAIIPAEPRRVLERARPVRSSSLRLALAAAVVVAGVAFLLSSTPAPTRATTIGRVRPPVAGDVEVVHAELGQGRTFVALDPGAPVLAPSGDLFVRLVEIEATGTRRTPEIDRKLEPLRAHLEQANLGHARYRLRGATPQKGAFGKPLEFELEGGLRARVTAITIAEQIVMVLEVTRVDHAARTTELVSRTTLRMKDGATALETIVGGAQGDDLVLAVTAQRGPL